MAKFLERMAYVSEATIAMESLLVITQILAVSQRNNRRDHISGALVYSDGVFFQVVEGAPSDLDRLISRLAADPRHRQVKTVFRSAVPGRLFGDWSMTAPRIRPDMEPAMKAAITACESFPTVAIEMLRRLALEDIANTV